MKLSAVLCVTLMLPIATLAAPPKTASGTWKIDGVVQDTPVNLICVLTETDHKLTGKCSAATGDPNSHTITGETTEKDLGFQFDTLYQGSPITVAMHGSLDATGDKMSGVIAVDPMNVDGTFTANRLPDSPDVPPASTPTSAPVPPPAAR